MSSKNVEVEVLYINNAPKWVYEKPFFLSDSASYETEIITNFEGDRRRVHIEDIRGKEDTFVLEKHGFCVKKHATNVNLKSEGEQDTLAYIRETIQLLEEHFPTSVVICYDVRRRSSMKDREQLRPVQENAYDKPRMPAPPVSRVHADHTVNGGFHRARRHLSNQELKKYIASGQWRLRIINTWRPLKEIHSAPLAFIDYRTVELDDLVESDSVNTEYVGENYCVRYNPNHSFYWLSNQKPSELYIFVAFDSENSVSGAHINTCPHTSFELPESAGEESIRESVETRCFILTPISPDTAQEKMRGN